MRRPEGNQLYAIRGVWWATLLSRLGHGDRAQAITEANLLFCEHNWLGRNRRPLPRSSWRARHSFGGFPKATRLLAEAVSVFRRVHQIQELPGALLAQADLERRQCLWDEALRTIEAALRLAAPRDMRLDHADALVQRARIRLDRAQAGPSPASGTDADRAGDDLDAAVTIARDCGYAWAELDALFLLAEVQTVLGAPDKAARNRRAAETLSRRLLDTTPLDPDPYAFAYVDP